MNRFLKLRFNRFVTVGLVALGAATLAPASANATPFVLRMTQSGVNVVASGNGAFDLAGLTLRCTDCRGTIFETIKPSAAWLNIGAASYFPPFTLDNYVGPITGPANFGSGSFFVPTFIASGSTIVFNPDGLISGVPALTLPHGYTSGSTLADVTTWVNSSFASLGVTPGKYVWTWGNTTDQSFTLDIVNSVPEPAELGMFGLGLLLMGSFVGLRRRTV